jgi:hemoglobin
MRSAHTPFPIDSEARDAWTQCMFEALRDAPLEKAARDALTGAFVRMAAMLVNREGSLGEKNTPTRDFEMA